MKKLLIFVTLITLFATQSQAQDTTGTQNSYFLEFVKKVYFNPTVLLRTQKFRDDNKVRALVLPDLNGGQANQITGFEKAMQKIIRFLIEGDDKGSIRFYFDSKNATKPFSFVCSDELWCKFPGSAKDSIEKRLNAPFQGANFNLNSHVLFETAITGGLNYATSCLQNSGAECSEEPDNKTTEINTKPLAISLHNTSGSKFDIDTKQFEQLASHYAKATDLFTQQDWYAPAKVIVSGASSDEPMVLAIQKHETLFKKENLKIKMLYNNSVLPVLAGSTNDSIRFAIPKDLPKGNPVEVVVTYKSPVDSITYTVGFFMVQVMEKQTVKLNLLAANGFNVSDKKTQIENELKKVYDPVGITFEVAVKTWNPMIDSEWPVTIQIESSGLLSNYPPDLRDWVNGVQDLNDYDKDEYYLVFGLSTSGLAGYMPRARNIGFIFSRTADLGETVAHELGHGVFHLRHIFADEELGEQGLHQTRNVMDYKNVPANKLKDLYLHQWKFIADPAFVSWFSGDDEDAALPVAVSYRCLPVSITKKYAVESYINTSGEVVQLNASQTPYAFIGSDSEYSGRLLMLTQSNKYYYACKLNEEYPGYYQKKSANGLDVNKEAVLGKDQTLSPTIISIDEACNYSIKRQNEPVITGSTDNCECKTDAPQTIVSNYEYAIGPLVEKNNKNYAGSPNNFSCSKFVLNTGKFAKLPSELLGSITSFELTEDNRLYSFTIGNKEYVNAVWGAKKKNTSNPYEIAGGSDYFICFEDVEELIGSGIVLTSNGDQFYYTGVDLSANFVKKIKDSDISFYQVGEETIQILSNGSIGCGPAPMTLSILENSILNCNLSACMSNLNDFMTIDNLKLFKTVTQDHILEYMFSNVQVEHPYATEPYGRIAMKNSDSHYILIDLMRVFAQNGRIGWFVETFLLRKNNIGQINLQKIATGQDDINLKCEFSNELFEYLNNPSTKKYDSPVVAIKDAKNKTINFPASVNTVIPYYENWFQTSNAFVVKSEKCNVVVKADEFDFHYEKGLIKIEQSGTYNVFKTSPANDVASHQTKTNVWTYEVLTKLVDAGVDFDDFINNEVYDDSYYLHPYDFVEITLGKAIPELGLKEGQTLAFPAFFVTVLGQFGKDKVSAQNFQIFVGVVAVASAVFTGGASIAALSTTAGTMTVTALTGEILTISLGVVTTGFDVADLYFVATEGNQNLSAAELKFRENVSKVALYLNMLEIGVGGFSALKKLVKVGGVISSAEKLLSKLDDLGLSALKSEINLLDETTKAKFINAFEDASDDVLKQLNAETDLVNVWRKVAYLKNEARDLKFLQALKKVESDDVWKHILGEAHSATFANGGHVLTNTRRVFIEGEIWIYTDKIRFKASNIQIPNPWTEGMDILKAKKIEITNGTQWVPKTGGGMSSFFPQSWSKQRILEETALAYKKAKADPNTYWDAASNGNAYHVMSTDGQTKIAFFYGANGEINPLLSGSANPIIRSSFPKY